MKIIKLQQNDGARRGHRKVYISDPEKMEFHSRLLKKSILQAHRVKEVTL